MPPTGAFGVGGGPAARSKSSTAPVGRKALPRGRAERPYPGALNPGMLVRCRQWSG